MLTEIMTKIQGAVGFIGAMMFVWGLVNLGLNIKDGAQGGGGRIAGAIAMMAGGAVVIAAAVYFGSLDLSWAQ